MVAVVEGDGVVLYGDAAVEPSGAVGGKAQRHFGGAAGRHVDGGQRALVAADEELQRHLLGVVAAAVVHSDLHGYAAALEVSRSVEDEGVDEQVVGFGALQGYEGYVGETVGRQRVEVGGAALEVADDVSVAVGGAAGGHEGELTAYHVGK